MKTLEQRLHDGSRAREILENEQWQATFDAIENEVIESWKTSQNAADREKQWTYLQVLQKVQMHLVSTLETGKLAELELEHKKTLQERLGQTFSAWY